MIQLDRVSDGARRSGVVTSGVLALGCTAALLIVAVMIKADMSTPRSVGLILSVIGGIVLLSVPTEWLPAIALVAFAVVPGSLVPTVYLSRAFTPATIVLALWAARVILSRRPLRVPVPAVLWSLAGLVVWSTATSYLSAERDTSIAWTLSIGLAVLLPVVFATNDEVRVFVRTWLVLGAILSLYAIVEAVAQRNLLYGSDVQHWSVYRAYAGFGHPLLAGSFFVATFGLALGMWLAGSRRPWLLPTALVSLVATFATISRGAIVSAVLVVALLLLVATVRRGAGLSRVVGVITIVVVAAFAALQTPRVVERLFSVEGSRSNDARRSAVDVAMEGAEHHDWLGAGPAMSQNAVEQFNTSQVLIESSYLQLLITVGIPGVLLLFIALASAARNALNAQQFGAVAVLVGVAVSIGFYNAIDARWGSHVLLGLALILCIHRWTDSEVAADKAALP